jgi:hypothetical protein
MRKTVVVFVIGAFVLLTIPVWNYAAPAPRPRPSGSLAGHIFNEDMKTPVRNAIVKLRNVETLKEYESEPTDVYGMYKIPEVEEGRYVMGVLGPRGNYNFHYSIMIKSDALAKLSVAMKSGSAPVRLEQGYGDNKKATFGEFFTSPAGILVIATAVEFTLWAIVLKEEPEVSPIY